MHTVFCRAKQGEERHGSAGGFTLIELSGGLAILSIILGLLLPAVQRVQGAAEALPKGNSLKRSLIDWGDGTLNIQRDTALVVIAMSGNSPASGNAPSWQTVCSELGTSGATANSLVTQVQTALNGAQPLRPFQRRGLETAQKSLMGWLAGSRDLATAISSLDPNAPCTLPY
jgi:hypothetical protein